MKTVHKNRLLKLAAFLDVLPRKKFDFSVVTRGTDIPRKELDCGTVGCAIGYTPLVFPRWAKYAPSLSRYYGGPGIETFKGEAVRIAWGEASQTVRDFFGLSSCEARALFVADSQFHLVGCNLPRLSSYATPKQVSRNIKKFVAWKEKNKDA